MINKERLSTKKWFATAPSNIALIKYMGKVEGMGNRPTNSSLSYTLPHLRSLIELELLSEGENEQNVVDQWEPLIEFEGKSYPAMELSPRGRERFLKHLAMLKSKFGLKGQFVIRSTNDFPSDCGLASSASSFAALTKVFASALRDWPTRQMPPLSVLEAADLSRMGSGSSCRSFFAPWAIWSADRIGDVPELQSKGDLIHMAVVVSDTVKSVSSSEAHRKVATSLLFSGRPERAENRIRRLISALSEGNWRLAHDITWAEFWDMHALFETCEQPFTYMTADSIEVLNRVRQEWTRSNDGPLVTMDAGPNVHLLFRADQVGREMADHYKYKLLQDFRVIS